MLVQHMVKVDISGCGMITDANIEHLVQVFQHLQILRFGNNSNISDQAMKSIAISLKDLHTLDIRYFEKIVLDIEFIMFQLLPEHI